MKLLVATQPVFNEVILWVLGLGFFAFVIWGVLNKISDCEAMEGIWYCSELKMQISFTDPKNAFVMENGEKIRCRCDIEAANYCYGIIEVCCQEWEHPSFTHGKNLFVAKIRKYNEMSMVVYDRKSRQEYTFVRTDKIE